MSKNQTKTSSPSPQIPGRARGHRSSCNCGPCCCARMGLARREEARKDRDFEQQRAQARKQDEARRQRVEWQKESKESRLSWSPFAGLLDLVAAD